MLNALRYEIKPNPAIRFPIASTPFQWLNPECEDFRQKVMQAIELDGLKKSEASQVFNISRNTINL